MTEPRAVFGVWGVVGTVRGLVWLRTHRCLFPISLYRQCGVLYSGIDADRVRCFFIAVLFFTQKTTPLVCLPAYTRCVRHLVVKELNDVSVVDWFNNSLIDRHAILHPLLPSDYPFPIALGKPRVK